MRVRTTILAMGLLTFALAAGAAPAKEEFLRGLRQDAEPAGELETGEAGDSAIDFEALEKYNVACGEECGRQYDDCERYCDPYGGPTGCDQCREDLQVCQQWCSICPTMSEWTETRLADVLPTYQPWVCLAGKSYYPVTARYRITRYRRTVNCDYSFSTIVVSVRYVDQPCYQERIPAACSPSFGLKPQCIIPWNYI